MHSVSKAAMLGDNFKVLTFNTANNQWKYSVVFNRRMWRNLRSKLTATDHTYVHSMGVFYLYKLDHNIEMKRFLLLNVNFHLLRHGSTDFDHSHF